MIKKSKFRKNRIDNQYISFIKNNIAFISFTVILIFYMILNSLNYSISDQAYFYTLSTISQTLAALIGIISIFIIYRLQLLKSEKSQYIEQLRYLTSKDWFIEKFPFFKLEYDKYLKKNIDIVLEAIKTELYLFSWDNITKNDDMRLIEFLKDRFNIEWVKKENISKTEDCKTIIVSNKEKSLSLKLNDEKTKVNLKIDDGRVDEFAVKTENGELNIYTEFTQDQHEFRRIASLLNLNTITTSLYLLHFSHPFRIGAVTIIISIFLLPFGSIILPEKSIFPIFNSTTAIGTAVALSIYCVISIIESLVNLLKSEYN